MGGRIAERKIKRITVIFSDGTVEHRGTTSDLSHTGMFIRTRKILKPGTPVKLTMELNENRNIALTGVVARFVKLGTTVFKDGIGVKLTTIPPEYKDLVQELLQK